MDYEFDLAASQKRIARVDRTISAQKLFIISTSINRKFDAALNLQTLESMRMLLGVSAKIIEDHIAREQREFEAQESLS